MLTESIQAIKSYFKRCGMTDKSLNGLIEFLDYLAQKGLMAKNTVHGRKAAVSGVLGVLEPEEKTDVTVLNLDSVMQRFVNLQGKKYNPSSLGVYKSRTNAAITDFKNWLGDPAAFKPPNGRMERKSTVKNPQNPKSALSSEGSASTQSAASTPTQATTSANVFPIQIRENLVVRIQGLPFDLTEAEAKRISNIVLAMAMG
jgi:hypothetical protein